MATKEEAIIQIAAIAERHRLTAGEVAEAIENRQAVLKDEPTSIVSRILGYLGGTFLFAGICVFIALNWDLMNTPARIIITLGSGLAAFVLALIACGDERYKNVRAPLFLVAAALQPTGILVAISEFSSGGDARFAALATAGVMMIQQGFTFVQKRETTLLLATLLFSTWFIGVFMDLVGMDGDAIALSLGLIVVLFCLGLEKTPHQSLAPFGYFAGAIGFYYGLFEVLEGTWIELTFLVAACGGVFLSTYARSRTLLVISIAAILGYVSYFTGEHFLESMGWPFMLMLLGLVLTGLATLAMRINKRYIR